MTGSAWSKGVGEMTGLLASVVALVGVLAWMLAPMAVQADPLDDLTDPIEDTVDKTTDTVDKTVNDAVGTAEGTGEAVTGAAGGGGGGGGASGVLDGAGDATGDGGSIGGGGSDVTVSGGASGGSGASSLGRTAEQRGDRAARGQREVPGSREGGARAAQIARVAAEATAGFPSGAAAYIPLLVRVTNDANDDGSYSDAEAAPLPDADVPFQIRLENAGSSELAILALRDTSLPMETADDAPCSRLVHMRLASGESTTCRFTVNGFAPAEGQRVVTIFEVDAAVTNQPSIVGTVADTTLVTAGSGNVLGEVIRRALAGTGAQIVLLSYIVVGFLVAGSALIGLANGRGLTVRFPATPQAVWTRSSPRGHRLRLGVQRAGRAASGRRRPQRAIEAMHPPGGATQAVSGRPVREPAPRRTGIHVTRVPPGDQPPT
jgi:hypothetical protein